MRKIPLLTLVITIFVTGTSTFASTYRERAYTFPKDGFPDSIADCKKIGDFQCVVSVVPNEFVWNGHRIEVYESWLGQRNTEKTWLGKQEPTDRLYFKLKIDGNLKGEYRLHKRGLNLVFRRDPAVQLTKDEVDRYNTRACRQLLLGIPSGEYVHYAKLSQPDSGKICLRLGSYNDAKNESEAVIVMSDVVLTFDLTGCKTVPRKP
jgi:hypothetical protein